MLRVSRGGSAAARSSRRNGNKLRALGCAPFAQRVLWPVFCTLGMQETAAPPLRKALRGVKYACERRPGVHWSLSREILLIASGLQHASSNYWFCNSARARGFAHACAAAGTLRRPPAAALLARRISRRPNSIVGSLAHASRRDPRPKNDEHLLPLAGREPGPDETRRGQPGGEPADHNKKCETSAPRGSRSSTRIRTGELAATSGIRSVTQPEATHPPEQFTGLGPT